MNDKQQAFDFDAFVTELNRSESFTDSQRADLKRAISAGKSTSYADIEAGQIWANESKEHVLMVLQRNWEDVYSLMYLDDGACGQQFGSAVVSKDDVRARLRALGVKLVANSLKEYLAAGGTL